MTIEPLPFQYQSLVESNQIRLITILPQELGSGIRLELEHVDMNSDPKYECLSYAWGQDDHDRPIAINDSTFLVSSTLYVALEHLRYRSQERRIWIDAICINQTNIPERNTQVAMMKKIYRNATRVVIWIGPATESSEQAMAFLKIMATAKKNQTRKRLRNGRRLASDTSSELGSAQHGSTWSLSSAPYDSEEQADVPEECASFEHHDKAVSGDENAVFLHAALLDREANSRPIPLCSTGALPDDENLADSLFQWNKIKAFPKKLYRSLKLRYSRYKKFRSGQQELNEYEEALATMEATKNNYTVTGYPILYNMFGDPYEKYFTEEWDSHWQALDELLARPWWGRTWIVQEVWCASDAQLQCGATKIKWKTFQKAMDYSEGWDDMGDHVKGMERQLHWETLRRRYTLAIHLSKARVNGSTLSSLLWNTWDRASTDPRDKVFVVLGLAGEPKNEDISIAPDYRKSMDQVYRETAREIITKEGRMDILLAASGIDGNDDLPSWVPDWRSEATVKRPILLVNRQLLMKLAWPGSMDMAILEGHGYRAAGNSEAFALFSDNLRALTVLSKKLDSIAEVCDADIITMSEGDFIDQSFDFVVRSKFVASKTRRKESAMRGCTTESLDTSILITALTGGGRIKYDEWAPTMRNIMRKRRLFITKNGYTGIGSVDAQPHDMVFIISGCNFPITLRPRENKFAVIGEAYIHGYMNGEALARPWYNRWTKVWKKITLV
ncbi:hypothetical protein G6011_11466 [Alternaria panax]|uniref:Heterokaryon incompatibility domain-containing protein n=1 Tax=Alternaria panax TaxID=48097 RepID=A0AAD4IDG2_9PLEO|nr:hypothetical protein G6011_11466 [Alternaria panax]